MGHIDPVAETGDIDNGKGNEQPQNLITNRQRMARLVSPGNYRIQMRLTVSNAIKLIDNSLKEARRGAFWVHNCQRFEKMRMPSGRRRSA